MLVPTKILKNIVKAAARESTRYAINGVLLERDDTGPVAVATDGRWLMSARWVEQPWKGHPLGTAPVDGFKVIIPASDLIEAAKLPPKRTPKDVLKDVVLHEHDSCAIVTTVEFRAHNGEGACNRTAPIVEGKFPAWRDVMPNGRPDVDVAEDVVDAEHASRDKRVVRIGINPKILIEAVKAVSAMGCNDDSPAIVLEVPVNGCSPIVVKNIVNEGAEVVAAIMPLSLKK